MTAQMKKSLLIGLGVFLTIILAIGVVYLVRKPTTPIKIASTPQPVATPAPVESPITAPIFVVNPGANVCTKSFTVACGSSSPTPSPSSSVPALSPSPTSSPSTPPSAALDCSAKRMYMDDSRNRAGFYYIENEIVDTNVLQNGQIILYNVVVKNTGGNTVPDTTITDKLSANLTYVDGDTGCTYDATTRVVTCTVGALASNSEAQRTFRVSVNVAGGTTSVSNTAEVSSTNGQRDSCSVQIDATGKVVVQPSPVPTALPQAGVFEVTAGTLGIGLLLLVLGGLGLLLI